MPTWKEQMEKDARYARGLLRPGVYTMPLPEDEDKCPVCGEHGIKSLRVTPDGTLKRVVHKDGKVCVPKPANSGSP